MNSNESLRKPDYNEQLLLEETNQAFRKTIDDIKQQNASIVMPTFYPQRGNLLEEAALQGTPCIIIGGNTDEQEYPHVPQIGLPGMDAGFATESRENGLKIIKHIPQEVKKAVIFEYQSHEWHWIDLIRQERPDIEIIAEATGYTHPILENKIHLAELMKYAGLEQHTIPSLLVNTSLENRQLQDIYTRFSNPTNGKIVIQYCGPETLEEGGGKSTEICSTFKEFEEAMTKNGRKKVSQFIIGQEANISWYAGNIIPNPNGLGSLHLRLPENIDIHSHDAIQRMLENARTHGITGETIIVIVGRAIAKVVGDPTLTAVAGNGVGNDLAHIYSDFIRTQFLKIGHQLGYYMATLGKIGLAGADAIVDTNNHVWVNEINDRQQGPTAQLCRDAELAGLPRLDTLAWISHYADFNDPKVKTLFQKLQINATKISEAYMVHHRGSFYLKLNSKHDRRIGSIKTVRTLEPGLYRVAFNEKMHRWIWTKTDDLSNKIPVVGGNPSDYEPFHVHLRGPTIYQDRMIPTGKQLMRIEGIAADENQNPIGTTIDGTSCINPGWKEPLEDLYEYIFGEGYNETNPLVDQD